MDVPAIKYGRENEKNALAALVTKVELPIEKCGLFKDRELPFLCATPDGICVKDTVIEVKCPITAQELSIEQAINSKKNTFWKRNMKGQLEVNKNHDCFFQILGQLHITRREKCLCCMETK